MKKSLIFSIIFLLSLNLIGQTNEKKVVPFLKTGAGYFSDELMIDGKILSGELGIKLSNSYFFSLQYSSADAFNDVAAFSGLENVEFNFIYIYRIYTLNIGYELMSKNKRHSFLPMLGPFYSENKITTPTLETENKLELEKIIRPNIGFSLALQYLYNFKNGISVGLNASGSLAYQYGPLYYSVMPVVSFNLK